MKNEPMAALYLMYHFSPGLSQNVEKGVEERRRWNMKTEGCANGSDVPDVPAKSVTCGT